MFNSVVHSAISTGRWLQRRGDVRMRSDAERVGRSTQISRLIGMYSSSSSSSGGGGGGAS